MTPRLRITLSVVTTAVLGAAIIPLVAVPAGAASPAGLLRVAQLSPNSPPVDVYVDDSRVLTAAAFTTIAPYRSVPIGAHTVTVRAGNTDASSPALATKAFTVADGQDYTALVLGAAGALHADVIHDELLTPPAGKASVRLLHAAPGVPAVDVNTVVGAVRLFSDVAYDVPTGYQNVAGGSYDITMAKAGTAQVLFTVRGVAVKAGSAYTLAAVGGAGHALQVLPLVDAATGGRAPVGGVQTGFGGGLATHGLSGNVLVGVLGGLAVLCAGGALLTWRGLPGAGNARR